MDWQNEFIQLYTSNNLEDILKAFELKRKHLPSKLYRYRAVSKENLHFRKNEIAKGELFLSHPETLNHPFECWSILRQSSPVAYVNRRTYIDYYSAIGQTQELNVILQNDDWFEALVAIQASKADSLEDSTETERAIKDCIMFSIETFNKDLRKRVIDMIRFACFSTTATNLPMWYHYADKRKGVCLEYSTSDIADIYQSNSLFPVQYVDQLPDMTYMLAHRDKTSASLPTYLSFHKLNDWAYEREWRMIYDAGYWVRKGHCLPDGFANKGVAITFVKPEKVILGIDMEPEMEVEIITCAQEHDVKVVKSQLTEYGICIE